MSWNRKGGGVSVRVLWRDLLISWFSRALVLSTGGRLGRGARACFDGDRLIGALCGVSVMVAVAWRAQPALRTRVLCKVRACPRNSVHSPTRLVLSAFCSLLPLVGRFLLYRQVRSFITVRSSGTVECNSSRTVRSAGYSTFPSYSAFSLSCYSAFQLYSTLQNWLHQKCTQKFCLRCGPHPL